MRKGLQYSPTVLLWLEHSNRLRRYIRGVIGIMRYGDCRPWHPLMRFWNVSNWYRRYWYIGLRQKPRPPKGSIVTARDEVLEPVRMGDELILIPWVEPYRTNGFSRWLNRYWDRLHTVSILRY